MKVSGTGSRSMLEEYAKDNYNARFHTAITAAVNCTLVLDLMLISTKSVEREMYVKGSGSWCVLGQYLKVKNYASFHTHSYHGCIEMHLCSRFEVNFDSHWRIKCCFFLFSLTSLSRLFNSYGQEPIGRWGETGVPRENHLKHPQTELGLFPIWPVRGSNLHSHSGEMIE